ncbi:MAG: RNase adapter RapZ, partial [Candidatus Limnocylindrus sp.]
MNVDRRVVLLTGLSGAGKTTATKSLADIGCRPIDSLAYELRPALGEKCAAEPSRCG